MGLLLSSTVEEVEKYLEQFHTSIEKIDMIDWHISQLKKSTDSHHKTFLPEIEKLQTTIFKNYRNEIENREVFPGHSRLKFPVYFKINKIKDCINAMSTKQRFDYLYWIGNNLRYDAEDKSYFYAEPILAAFFLESDQSAEIFWKASAPLNEDFVKQVELEREKADQMLSHQENRTKILKDSKNKQNAKSPIQKYNDLHKLFWKKFKELEKEKDKEPDYNEVWQRVKRSCDDEEILINRLNHCFQQW